MSQQAKVQVQATKQGLQVNLPAGQLDLSVEACRGSVDDLIGFAARANPKRAFLFVSKVLGKHYPARPSAMQAAHQRLAQQIPDQDGPLVFIGMAETATGLGQGVFEAWKALHPQASALLLLTTRYRVAGAKPLGFEEAHSHAPRVMLHEPQQADQLALFKSARQVVLVDDELSTGNTFINLIHELRRVMPALEQVHLSTLADLMGAARRLELPSLMGLPCSIGSLLQGAWSFTSNPAAPLIETPAAQCAAGKEVVLSDNGFGRLGRTACLTIPDSLLDTLCREAIEGPTLVLGCGEFMFASFALALALEQRGVDVRVQSTTRSPIQLGGAIGQILPVPDSYGEGVTNYLYNVQPGQYARVLICHELPLNDALRELARVLDGRLIHFSSDKGICEISVY